MLDADVYGLPCCASIELQQNRMILTIDLPEEQTAALAAKAKARGVSTEQYVRQVLEQDLAPEWLRQSWASAQQSGVSELSLEEIEAEIAAARKNRPDSSAHPGA
jgi:plasmid stability protein